MRKLAIITAMLISASAMAQTTNDYAVFYDGTDMYSEGGGSFTNINVNINSNQTFNLNKIEACLNVVTQSFTAASGFEIVTNFTYFGQRGNFTTTDSNVTVNTAGDYTILIAASFNSSAVNVTTDGHIFTNGTQVSRIGWSRKVATANDQGSAAGQGLITLAAGDIVDIRLDVGTDSNIGFDHLSLILIQQ